MAGEEADPAALAATRAQLGLDQPLPVQYAKFVGNALTGDLGRSTRTGTPVTEMIAPTLPLTVQLAMFAMLIAVLAGFADGVPDATSRGRWPEWLTHASSL